MLKTNAVGALHSSLHIWRARSVALKGQPTVGGKCEGAWPAALLDLTATERDCDGRLRESRDELTCSVRSGSPSLTNRLQSTRWGLGASAESLTRLPEKEESWKKSKNVGGESGLLGANFQHPPESRTGRRSQQVQGMTPPPPRRIRF